jgi:hypothetical protein
VEAENGLILSAVLRSAFLQKRVLYSLDRHSRIKQVVNNALSAFAGAKKQTFGNDGWCIDVATDGRVTAVPS